MTKEKIVLFIPSGYGRGTIIYDLENNPFEVGEDTKAGGNLREVVPVERDYAESRISQGAQVLISTK